MDSFRESGRINPVRCQAFEYFGKLMKVIFSKHFKKYKRKQSVFVFYSWFSNVDYISIPTYYGIEDERDIVVILNDEDVENLW